VNGNRPQGLIRRRKEEQKKKKVGLNDEIAATNDKHMGTDIKKRQGKIFLVLKKLSN
jgi:hypothetical protein